MLRITISKTGQPPTINNFDKREITIGRTPSNDVRIPEPGVSSSHARILYTDGSLTLIDLDSTNGTFVNGQRIQGPQMVQPGDEVYVCSHKLGFEIAGAPGAATPGPASAPGPLGPPASAPPPIAGPPGAPPPMSPAPAMPGPAPRPRMDPSLPPPLNAPGSAPPMLGGPASSPPPQLAVPSPAGLAGPTPARAGDGPTLPPMIGLGGGGGAPRGPSAGPPRPLAPPLSVPPPPAATPAPAPSPEPLGPPPSLTPPPPVASTPSAPPPAAGPEPLPAPLDPPAPVAAAPSLAPPEPAAPEPASAPAPIAPPTPIAPPSALAGPPEPSSPAEPPKKPSGVPQTPSTSAPGAAGDIQTPTAAPQPSTPSAPKVVLGSKSPIRTGETMMADHVALPRESESEPAESADSAAPPPSPHGEWSMPRVGPAQAPPPAMSPFTAGPRPTPGVPMRPRPDAIAGLDPQTQTREACSQVFRATLRALVSEPGLSDDQLSARLRTGLQDFSAHAPHMDVLSLGGRMLSELRGAGPLEAALRDSQVREVFVQGPSNATVKRNGQQASSADVSFTCPEALAWAVEHLTGVHFGPDNPVVEARTPDGHAVHAVHHAIALSGPIVSIRRAAVAQPRYELAQLTASATMSDTIAKLLAAAVEGGLRVAICAGPGAQAFPLVAALALASPTGQRHVVVRPDHEPGQLPPQTVILESARAGAMPALVDAALGLTPERLVVHEVSGPEAAEVIAAMGRGLAGAVLTTRATSAPAGLTRLATLCGLVSAGSDLVTRSLHVAQALDLIVVLSRFTDGITRVTQVARPGISPTGTAHTIDLVTLDPHTRNWTHTAALNDVAAELRTRGLSVDLGVGHA